MAVQVRNFTQFLRRPIQDFISKIKGWDSFSIRVGRERTEEMENKSQWPNDHTAVPTQVEKEEMSLIFKQISDTIIFLWLVGEIAR